MLCRCGGYGECICNPGYSGPDCSTREDTCGCGQFEEDCGGTCDMFLDCSGHGRCVYV